MDRARGFQDEKPLSEIDFRIAPELPAHLENAGMIGRESHPTPTSSSRGVGAVTTWEAPAVIQNTNYCEDVALERYGLTRRPLVQPFVSGGRFVADTLLLPYRMLQDPPTRLHYQLGMERPGNCVPPIRQSVLTPVPHPSEWLPVSSRRSSQPVNH
ncbi:MAG: hypothetical protein KDA83_00410 [Planctomycetales bacterium]|nr:hypothetical protein [Planctomycetales bacterium]